MFAEALKPLVRAAGIVGASRHLLAEAARLLPELRDSLDLPPASDVEDEAARVRFFEGVAALVDAAAYERPLLIVLDDLHDAGPSSLDMLSYLAARLRGSAVMFALSAQPARAPASVLGRLRSLASLGSDGAEPASRSTLISLSPLSRDAAAAAIEDAAQRLRIPQLVVERILDRAGGLPALLPELLRRAESGDDIAQVPVSIRSLLQNRIQSLSSGQRRTFLVLALFGRPVSMSILAAAAHLSPQAAAETAGALLREELAERSEAGEIQPNPTAAELGLEIAGQASRAFLAGWIAEALADNRSTHPAELARFFSMAGRIRGK
jgi:predicted ATPase